MSVRGVVMGCGRALTIALAFVVSFAWSGRAFAAGELEADGQNFRAKMLEEIRRESPAAAEEIEQGDVLRDEGRMQEALPHYEEAARQLPGSSHPSRRICSVQGALGRKKEAVAACESALAKSQTPTNQAALALALTIEPSTPTERQRAVDLADRAAASDDLNGLFTKCQVALAADDMPRFQQAAGRLGQLAPSSPETHMMLSLRALSLDSPLAARKELDRARELGASDAELAMLEKAIDDNTPFYVAMWPATKSFLLVWLSLGVVVTLLGLALSSITRKVAHDLPAQRTGHAHGSTAWVRRAYRVVLWLACVLFYLTLPILVASTIALAIGLFYVFMAIGRIPIQIMLVVGLVAIVTVFSTLKSLFVKVDDSDPGERIDLSKHPKLDALLEEVAKKVGTRKVDTVFLTPGTELAVFERGGLGARLRGAQVERCLILGAAVLKDMRLLELKAILAHEYGHFQNEDTAGGTFALAVRRSIMKLIIGLARGGAATWYNPAWWLVRGFFALFLRVSHGASRLQEILADRWAAFSYGAEAFEGGLTHAVRRGVMFEAVANASIKDAIDNKRSISNLYGHKPNDSFKWDALEEEVQESLNRTASPYDSHPAPTERFALVRKLDAPTPETEDANAKAWSIFEDRGDIERRFTKEMLSDVEAQLGVRLYAPAKPSTPAESTEDTAAAE
ncbi:MAG: M48 family metalloprotease [Polyangiaceae bacterium]|nr:M48 family metalloprotease [Polyangiaceae bacterium]